jgi:Uncharacterized protein conserved in bacteria
LRLPAFTLIGLDLGRKTTNEGGQSGIDCGSLWQKFEKENIAEKIPGKTGNEIYAAYFAYEGDHTRPFSYFIGCKVQPDSKIPQGLNSLKIPEQEYIKVVASGKMPDCISNAWIDIWRSDIKRAHQFDFEMYDERSRNWEDAEVDIFLSV